MLKGCDIVEGGVEAIRKYDRSEPMDWFLGAILSEDFKIYCYGGLPQAHPGVSKERREHPGLPAGI